MYNYYTNSLFTSNTGSPGTEYWNSAYRFIYICNEAIEGLSASTSLTPAVQQQLLGEAKFTRAFLYFYLVNLYGSVPLATSSDYEVNARLSRSPVDTVYQQIVKDLNDAQGLLADNYMGPDVKTLTPERVRPNKWAAMALLARVYLFKGDYPNAEAQATAVINHSSVYGLTTLDSVFLKNSREAIWQLQPIFTGWNTEDAKVFIIPASGPSYGYLGHPVYLSSDLLNSFEPGDQRSVPGNWIDSVSYAVSQTERDTVYFPYKYKSATFGSPVTEYLMVLRLGEQYLIRAEARAHLGEATAVDDLNAIRNRAGLPNYTGLTDQASLLAAILHERRVELFSEWGHRWLDLKRTNTVDAVMTAACAAKGGTWQSYQQWYPILASDIEKDQNLVQNTGY